MHTTFIKKALELAKIRRGFCSPNPAVGAVVVKNDHIISTGYHWASGHPHAEVEALNKLGDEVRGATLYVTLEPCCHKNKKTPPCTDLLIERGIKQVFYSYRDPNPQVAGLGEKTLKEAGINCEYVANTEVTKFYQSYNYWWQTKKPFMTAKIALSLDGKIAGANGQRINITGKEAKYFTHEQRKLSDAILTTARTIVFDDPLLNVRLNENSFTKPIYVLDRQLITPLNAKIFSSDNLITIFHDKNIKADKLLPFHEKKIRCIPITTNANNLVLSEVIQFIGNDGIHDLWIEAGGKLFSNLVSEKLLQRAFIYIAPRCLGKTAQTAFNSELTLLDEKSDYHWFNLGQDAVCQIDY